MSVACRNPTFVSEERTLLFMGRAHLRDVEVRYVTGDGNAVVTSLQDVRPDVVVAGLPVRTIRSFAGQKHYPGMFWSVSIGKHIWYESLLERDRLWLADFDDDVVGIAAQPFWFSGSDKGSIRRHVPDLLLERRDGSFVVVDVKPAEFAQHPKAAAVFNWTGRLCAAKGWRFEVWSGADPTLLANIRLLGSSRRRQFVSGLAIESVRYVAHPGTTMADIEAAADVPAADARRAVLWLLWSQEWSTDLTVPLCAESVIQSGQSR